MGIEPFARDAEEVALEGAPHQPTAPAGPDQAGQQAGSTLNVNCGDMTDAVFCLMHTGQPLMSEELRLWTC